MHDFKALQSGHRKEQRAASDGFIRQPVLHPEWDIGCCSVTHWRTIFFVFSLLFGLSLPFAKAQSLQQDCDALAAAPTDENKQGPGVPYEKLDANSAIPACEAAVRDSPTIARFRFQLGRALNKAGRFVDAARYYEPLTNSGYSAAAHSLAMLYIDGTGVPQNSGRAIALLTLAANHGYLQSQDTLGSFYAAGSQSRLRYF